MTNSLSTSNWASSISSGAAGATLDLEELRLSLEKFELLGRRWAAR